MANIPIEIGNRQVVPMQRGTGPVTSNIAQTSATPPQIIYIQGPPMHHQHGALQPLPSSEPDDMDDPTIFPRVRMWLEKLDSSALGLDGHSFAVWAYDFENAKYYRISQIADCGSVEMVASLCPGIPAGTASLILQAARREVKGIRKRERQQKRRYE